MALILLNDSLKTDRVFAGKVIYGWWIVEVILNPVNAHQREGRASCHILTDDPETRFFLKEAPQDQERIWVMR